MTTEQAKELLDVATFLTPEEMDDDMRAALRMTETNPELRAWYEARKAFDERVSSGISAVRPPPGLRDRIVSAMAKAPAAQRRSQPWPWPWLAAAAAAALIVSLAAKWTLERDKNSTNWQREALVAVRGLDSGQMPLDQWSGDVTAVRQWLATKNSPAPAALPESISSLKPFGCKLVKLDGRPASIICFALPGSDKEAHLVVVENSRAMPTGPTFQTSGEWTYATWNENGRVLMLATRAPSEMLRKLFA